MKYRSLINYVEKACLNCVNSPLGKQHYLMSFLYLVGNKYGRDRSHIKILSGLHVLLDETPWHALSKLYNSKGSLGKCLCVLGQLSQPYTRRIGKITTFNISSESSFPISNKRYMHVPYEKGFRSCIHRESVFPIHVCPKGGTNDGRLFPSLYLKHMEFLIVTGNRLNRHDILVQSNKVQNCVYSIRSIYLYIYLHKNIYHYQ